MCGGIVAADRFCGLGGEPDFAADECQAMGAAQWAEVDRWKRLLVDQIDDAEGVEGAEAVVRNVSGGAIGRSDDFVRVIADGDFRDYLQRRRIDDGEGVVTLGESEQRILWRSLSGKCRGKSDECEHDAE